MADHAQPRRYTARNYRDRAGAFSAGRRALVVEFARLLFHVETSLSYHSIDIVAGKKDGIFAR
jgi:hypothetical protein